MATPMILTDYDDDEGLEDALEQPLKPAKQPEARYGTTATIGSLRTTTDPQALYKALTELWEARKEDYAQWEVEWRVNERRRRGETNVWVDKTPDQGRWQVYVAPGAPTRHVAVYNKADRLCQRMVSNIYADPPMPDCVPSTGEPEDKDAAETATRILLDTQSEAGLNEHELQRRALDTASTARSAYIHYFVDPRGGGMVPIEVMASALAQTVEQATFDPLTLTPWPKETLKYRYVRSDGSLTDVAGEGATAWAPKVRGQVLHARNLRLIPHNACDVWEAEGIVVGQYVPFRDMERLFPDVKFTDTQLEEMTAFRPEQYAALIPLNPRSHKASDPRPDNKRDHLVLILRCYFRQCGKYPRGLHLALVGQHVVATQADWVETVGGTLQPADVPMSQVRQLRGPATDPNGRGLMDFLGNSNELRAFLLSVFQDTAEKNLSRKTFVPVSSILHAKSALLPGLSMVPINPGGEPKYEQLLEVPPEVPALLDRVDREMDDASGLQEMGQGLQSPNVQSGRQALAIVSQVHAGLSDIRQNAERAYLRSSRIELQLIRMFYKIPQMVRYVGIDGIYKVRRWLGSDLQSVRDVRLKPGTLSMMTPQQKANLAIQYNQLAVIDRDELEEIVRSSVGGTIGLQDNPHLQRVRRQIDRWLQGPPEGWVEGEGRQWAMAMAQAAQPPMLDPSGMMAPAPMKPPNPIFQPVPADSLPPIAALRVRELGRAQATTSFEAFPKEWQMVLEDAFATSQMALMPAAPMSPAGMETGGQEPTGKNPHNAQFTAPGAAAPGEPPALRADEQAVLGPQAAPGAPS